MNSNFNTDILSTTLDAYTESTMRDNIFDSNALFYTLKKEGAYVPQNGGKRILEPIMFEKNSTAKSYDGYELLDVTPQNGLTDAEFDWKQYSVQVSIDGKSERINSGDSAAINLLDTKIKQAEMSIIDQLNQGLFGDGTGNGGKDLTGVEIAVDSTGTYGNIARGTYSYWASYEESTSAVLTVAYVRNLVTGISSGGKDTPRLHITTDTLYNKYEELLFDKQRFVNVMDAEAGFDNIKYKGGMITWDEGCVSTNWYALNTNYLKFRYHPDADFKNTPFIQPDNQDAMVSKILWMGNLTGSNSRRQGKLTGKTAA